MFAVLADSRRAVRDVVPLLRFRAAGVRGRGRRAAIVAIALAVALTLAVATVPAYLPGAVDSPRTRDLLLLLPTAYVAFLLTTTFAIIGSGGGRELLPRDQAVAFPLSPMTDHLGALLLAPLNIAWIIQSWSLLGATAYVVGPHLLVLVQLTALSWLVGATSLAQAIAWGVEWVRRGHHGVAVVRSVGVLIAVTSAIGVATGTVAAVFDALPSVWLINVVIAPAGGAWLTWTVGAVVLVVGGLLAVAAGGWLANAVARRPSYDEVRAESQSFAPLPAPRSARAALVRTDRASVWRSVPLRRGILVLALLPGLVAAAGSLSWDLLPVLPGLVAAGGALLFGVNAWCLDGVGALWRDSLPVDPGLAFGARVQVMLEILLVATVLTLVVAGLRAGGLPTSAQAGALVATVVVVSLQVVARSMQWSVHRPYAMDLRSSRGTPAPPLAMLSYSGWLAVSSTVTGLLFSATSYAGDPSWAILLALPLVLAAVRRLLITAREWSDPDIRSRVVATVSAR